MSVKGLFTFCTIGLNKSVVSKVGEYEIPETGIFQCRAIELRRVLWVRQN
jgi:hypothetical protein